MIKFLIGVPGSGKTTFLAKKYNEEGWDFYGTTIFTGSTNATIKSFLFKTGIKDKFGGLRTIDGFAYLTLLYYNLLDDWKREMLEYKNRKAFINKLKNDYGIKMNFAKLDKINSIFRMAILKDGDVSYFRNYFDELKLYGIRKEEIMLIYDLYRKKEYYDFSLLHQDVLNEKIDDIFYIYTYNRYEDRFERTTPEKIIIDEAQDFPFIYAKQIYQKYETGQVKEILFAGDPAQEIFNFYAPNTDFLYEITKEKQFLVQTYRFGEKITDLANKFLEQMGYDYKIVPNKNRKSKTFSFNYSDDTFVDVLNTLLKRSEYKDITILARTKEQIKMISEILDKHKIPYLNLENYEYEMIQTLLQIINSVIEERKEVVEKIGIRAFFSNKKESVMSYLSSLGYDKQYIDLAIRLLESSKRVYLSTVHNFKGLESDAVIFYNDMPALINRKIRKSKQGWIYELKVVFTAITRAKYTFINVETDNPLIHIPPEEESINI
ncbi:MAG: 3'-5' exonuclease [Thermoplasmata archaeon]